MPLLVTGATGRTSAGVVPHLRAAGEEVRVLVRDSDKAAKTFEDLHGVEIVAGAFDDAAVRTSRHQRCGNGRSRARPGRARPSSASPPHVHRRKEPL